MEIFFQKKNAVKNLFLLEKKIVFKKRFNTDKQFIFFYKK